MGEEIRSKGSLEAGLGRSLADPHRPVDLHRPKSTNSPPHHASPNLPLPLAPAMHDAQVPCHAPPGPHPRPLPPGIHLPRAHPPGGHHNASLATRSLAPLSPARRLLRPVRVLPRTPKRNKSRAHFRPRHLILIRRRPRRTNRRVGPQKANPRHGGRGAVARGESGHVYPVPRGVGSGEVNDCTHTGKVGLVHPV